MKPSVAIQLDKVRNFRYSRKTIAMIEDLQSKPLSQINLEMQSSLVTVIWAGLQWEDPTLTIDNVFDILDDYDNELIIEKMSEALNLAFPTPTEKK